MHDTQEKLLQAGMIALFLTSVIWILFFLVREVIYALGHVQTSICQTLNSASGGTPKAGRVRTHGSVPRLFIRPGPTFMHSTIGDGCNGWGRGLAGQ